MSSSIVVSPSALCTQARQGKESLGEKMPGEGDCDGDCEWALPGAQDLSNAGIETQSWEPRKWISTVSGAAVPLPILS